MSCHDYFQTPNGPIYWKYDEPQNIQGRPKKQPTLLFIHAGVSDYTLWDDQVSYFTARGWGVLRYDIFGYGLSKPAAEYLRSDPRPKVKHYEHAANVARNFVSRNTALQGNSDASSHKFVAIGLSRGGGIAIELTVAYPDLVCGLVVVAGGVTGIEPPNKPEEDAPLGQWFKSMKDGDIERAATTLARYWGDGPLVKGARMNGDAKERLYAWCMDITQREADRTGGGYCIPFEGPEPPAAERLSTVEVPVATATGKYDETSTTEGMRILSKELRARSNREFDTAHMINMEEPELFNAWVEDFLGRFVS